MYTHRTLWAGIDLLARSRHLSLPQLALSAGLDQTALNPSKRIGADGKPRWPTTETLLKVLTASGTSLGEFSAMIETVTATEQDCPVQDLHP